MPKEHLNELFRSTEEQIEPVDAEVKGSIPKWLKGSLVRLGPGKFDLGKPGDFVMNHWFDGYAVLYKFDVQDGKVKFSKKFLQSDAYKKAVIVGRPVFTEFATKAYPDPCKNIFSRMMSSIIPDLTDNNTIGLFSLEDSLYATSETNLLYKVRPDDLKTMEKADLSKIVGLNIASSHTVRDEKGCSYCLGSSLISGIKHHIVKIPPSVIGKSGDAWKNAKILATIPASMKTCYTYYHSFGMSENYLVLIEQPMHVNVMKLLSLQVKGRSLRDCMDWQPNELNKFTVIEKSTGKVLPYKYKSSQPFFVFHHINTFEQDGHLIVDVIAYESPEIIDKMYLQQLRMSEFKCSHPGGGRRFVLPIPKNAETFTAYKQDVNLVTIEGMKCKAIKNGDTVTLTQELLSEPGYELPTINKSLFGKKYQYYYGVGLFDAGPFSNTIVKVDTHTGQILTWKESVYSYPGEVQFIPRPDAINGKSSSSAKEDDGILLSCVTDVRKDMADFLLILDARDLTEIARAEVMVHVPAAIHGIFMP